MDTRELGIKLAEQRNIPEHLKQAYVAGFEKASMSRGLSDVPIGGGPAQMTEALRLYGQAKALGTPTDRELDDKGISRKNFVRSLGRMRGQDRLSDARTDKKVNMIVGALAGTGIGAMGATGAGQGALGTLATSAIGAGAGTLAGKMRADTVNSRVLKTMKILKDRGVLTPELLQTAMPILT